MYGPTGHKTCQGYGLCLGHVDKWSLSSMQICHFCFLGSVVGTMNCATGSIQDQIQYTVADTMRNYAQSQDHEGDGKWIY
jgi:hypothetical protein